MVALRGLVEVEPGIVTSYRVVNAKHPTISIFDDVADAGEFDAIYEIQARTNPRLLNEVGRIELVARAEIPFGIPGCHYAVAPFTHINAHGTRFADDKFGILYTADDITTALTEVRHHQNELWKRTKGLQFDRISFRALRCEFDQAGVLDATGIAATDPVYDPDDYSASRALGASIRKAGKPGIKYHSVRSPGNVCWGLLTPRPVQSIIQSSMYEMIWDGRSISSTNKTTSV